MTQKPPVKDPEPPKPPLEDPRPAEPPRKDPPFPPPEPGERPPGPVEDPPPPGQPPKDPGVIVSKVVSAYFGGALESDFARAAGRRGMKSLARNTGVAVPHVIA
jgi:hypothetical protein